MTHFLETRRLILRHAKQEDFEALYQTIFSDAAVLKYVFAGGVLDDEQARTFFEQKFTFDCQKPYGLAVVSEKSTEAMLGFAGLIPARPEEFDGYEFGYVLSQQNWAKGYATEIAQGQINWAFQELDLGKLYALIHPQNTASVNVVKKLNLTKFPSVTIEGQGTRLVYVANRND